MKSFLPVTAIVAGLITVALISSSCKKTETDSLIPKQELVQGRWYISRIQLKLYSSGVFKKDTIMKATPHPENFVIFNGNFNFEYRFNTYSSEVGTYSFSGADSLKATTGINNFRWKMLTLTKDLFTVSNTANSDVYYPGGIVETYYTFIRY